MKKENISDAVGNLPDDIIEDAAAVRNTRSARPYAKIAKFAALAAVFALCIVGVRYLPALTPPDPVGTEPPIISPDEHPDMYSESPTGAPTEAPSDATAETPTEDSSIASTEPPTEAPIDNVGSFVPCVHNVLTETGSEIDSSYHSLSTTLIEYVGEENYNNWLEVAQKEKKAAYERGEASCPWLSIVEFVEYFDVPREILEISNATQHPTVDHNIDIIYAGEEAAEKYYTRDRYQDAAARHIIAVLRADLGHNLFKDRSTEFDAWQTEKNKNGWYAAEVLTALSKKLEAEKRDLKIPTSSIELFVANQSNISFVELIKYFEIPRETVEQIYSKYKNYKGFEGDFDLDALYAAEFDEEYYKTTSPLEIDMQFFTYDGK